MRLLDEKNHRCPTVQAQASLILSIPNYPPRRQGKTFENAGYFLDIPQQAARKVELSRQS
jgi:hypothetical protein